MSPFFKHTLLQLIIKGRLFAKRIYTEWIVSVNLAKKEIQRKLKTCQQKEKDLHLTEL